MTVQKSYHKDIKMHCHCHKDIKLLCHSHKDIKLPCHNHKDKKQKGNVVSIHLLIS